ncbi:predicted protein [Uncinocarpus reesii 1704]|uniref:Uncharacterized protein n=1 Tax=Uncinocarpus reesii (strain UAMH 1704) TaxID=336963 RepID=C4JNV2_UNCRE|nr:uncharacterized protein UREG_04422 [Uncinocarpus reesii 1704]EEP79576.1 predicted protein [Uncinocarpus reesii 1704]
MESTLESKGIGVTMKGKVRDVPDICDMETSDEDDSGGFYEEDDDHYASEREYGIDPIALQNVEWRDLRPGLQLEIIRNLGRIYLWPHIVALLHLSPEDSNEAIRHAVARKQQAEEENRLLGEMRAKQLNALLRIDNSVLRQSRVPTQLVFRNISKRHLEGARMQSDPTYLMSTAKDIIAAKCYLRRVGLDPGFVGEWAFDLATMQHPPSTNPNAVEELRWTLDSDDPSEIEQDTVAAIGVQNTSPKVPHRSANTREKLTSKSPRITPNLRFINFFGTAHGVVEEGSLQESKDDGSRLKPYRISASGIKVARAIFNQAQEPPRESPASARGSDVSETNQSEDTVVRLSIGPEGAARVDSLPDMSSPIFSHFLSSPPVSPAASPSVIQSDAPSEDTEMSALSKTKESTETSGPAFAVRQRQPYEKPVERTLSGAWWYDSNAPKPPHLTAESNASMRLQERLLAARAENEIRQLARSGSQNRAVTAPMVMQLPLRSSPLKYSCSSADGERPTTPQVQSSDGHSIVISSPVKMNDPGRAMPQMTRLQSGDSREAEQEHCSRYSPTPLVKTQFQGDTQAEKGANSKANAFTEANQMEVSIVSTQERPDNLCESNEDSPSRFESRSGHSNSQESKSSYEPRKNAPLRISSSNVINASSMEIRVCPQTAAQNTRSCSMESVEEGSQVSGFQDDISLPELPLKKVRKRPKKAVVSESQRRKSARLNPPEGRSLRPPKANVRYKF